MRLAPRVPGQLAEAKPSEPLEPVQNPLRESHPSKVRTPPLRSPDVAPPPARRGRLGGGEALDLLREERRHPSSPLRAGEGVLRDGVEPPAEGAPHALCPTKLNALVKNALYASHLEILNRLLAGRQQRVQIALIEAEFFAAAAAFQHGGGQFGLACFQFFDALFHGA